MDRVDPDEAPASGTRGPVDVVDVGAEGAVAKLESLRNDNNAITFYEDGELKKKTVREFATDALESFSKT